ncbi:MAG: hypothetical protein CVV17_09610, partial [Gammaproteobacteria bacterium HGW-Gammaproteobacteria-7]
MKRRFEQASARRKSRDNPGVGHYACRVTETLDMLLFGASGPVGRALRTRVGSTERKVGLVSRFTQADTDCEHWFRHDLYHPGGDSLPPSRAILCAGPLDGFTRWCERQPSLHGARLVALSSTSALVKGSSPDAHERALARTLLDCEQRLLA